MSSPGTRKRMCGSVVRTTALGTDNDGSRTWAALGQMTKTVTARTLRKYRTILKHRGPNNFPEEGRGITKNKVKFGLTGIMESKEDAPKVRDAALRGVPRR